ncbi:MAG: alpha/beta hydrolase [Thioalkalispiraceae bacterium]
MTHPDMHLVLLPGLDGTGKLFTPFIEQFPDRSQITVIEYPRDRHIPYRHLAEYITPFLPKDKPLVLLGESYSGPISLILASRNELNVHAVILVATFARYPSSFLKRITKYLPLSFLFRLSIPEFGIRHYCFGSDTNKTLSRLLRQSVKENLSGILAQRARDGSKIDVTNILHKVKVPCLYIAASQDRLVPHTAIKDLQDKLPNIQVVTVEGPHFILQVQPRQCYTIVTNFLSTISE